MQDRGVTELGRVVRGNGRVDGIGWDGILWETIDRPGAVEGTVDVGWGGGGVV